MLKSRTLGWLCVTPVIHAQGAWQLVGEVGPSMGQQVMGAASVTLASRIPALAWLLQVEWREGQISFSLHIH